jgi:hypothetical protein
MENTFAHSTFIMRRIVFTAFAICLVSFAFAQTDSSAPRHMMMKGKESSSGDNFMLQLGGTSWIGKPDSIATKGLSRSVNVYLMLDFPFKTNTHWSVAIGPGISTDNINFNKINVGIKELTPTLQFKNVSDTIHFKKSKLVTTYLEAPIELRYKFNPANDKKSVKIALGARVGTLLSAHTKEKELQSSSGSVLNTYIEKENSKRFFNKTRLSLMGRVGIGHYSLFATYSITPVFKEGFGPVVRPLTVGISLHGL